MKIKDYFTKNFAVIAIILINLLIFIAVNIVPNLSDSLLLNPELDALAKSPWTLITVLFTHEVLIHFLLNMVLVFIFGTQLSKETNYGVVFFTYILCGLLGSSVVLVYAPLIKYTGAPIAGASAAAFGLVAAYGALRPNKEIFKSKVKYWVVALFVVNALFTVQNPSVSVGGPAHAIGILVGLLIGFILKKKVNKNTVQTIGVESK
ncbi:MAG: rhomboid family intramembrane serine protease [Eubacteriales bacterium]|jgi:membrane associated rhomboid family serine protease